MAPSLLRAALLAVLVAAALRRSALVLPLPALEPAGRPPPSSLPAPPSPLAGAWAPNMALRRAERLFQGAFQGAESAAAAANGSLYILDRYAHIWAAHPRPATSGSAAKSGAAGAATDVVYELAPAPVGYVGPGRPLGFAFDAAGRLVICNSLTGLLRWTPPAGGAPAEQRVLANAAGGAPVAYANDLDIDAANGDVYFSDAGAIPPALNRAGFYDTMYAYLLNVLQARPRGRLLAWRAATGRVDVLVSGVWFANGVALAADGASVLVVETVGMRVLRRWLRGERAGATEVFIEGLPGFPDGLSRAADGGFWLALILPDSPLRPLAERGGPLARWALAWALKVAPLPARRWGCVVKLSAEGAVERVLMDPDGSKIAGVSAVEEHGGQLLMGHLSGDYVSVLDLAALDRVI